MMNRTAGGDDDDDERQHYGGEGIVGDDEAF
jgi:hypothetical protein